MLGVQQTHPPTGFVLQSPGSTGLADWELDRLLWSRSVENIATASTTITSLAQLLDQIGNIVINDNIAQQVGGPDVHSSSLNEIVPLKHFVLNSGNCKRHNFAIISCTGFQCSDVAPVCCRRVGGWEPCLCTSVQQGGHFGFREGLFRPLSFASSLFSRRSEIRHLHSSFPTNVCTYCALTTENSE